MSRLISLQFPIAHARCDKGGTSGAWVKKKHIQWINICTMVHVLPCAIPLLWFGQKATLNTLEA